MSDMQAIAARLTAIAERLKAATQGEWYVEHPQVYYKIRVAETRAYILEQNYGGIRDEADAYLIANAPADLRFLSAHVETLTQQVAESEKLSERRRVELVRLGDEFMVEVEKRVEAEQENARLTAEIARLRIWFDEKAHERLQRAEQQRDAAHAALDTFTAVGHLLADTLNSLAKSQPKMFQATRLKEIEDAVSLWQKTCADQFDADVRRAAIAASAKTETWMTDTAATQDGWQPIATAPRNGTEVLLGWFDGMDSQCVGFWHSREKAWCDTHQVLHNQTSPPTHWMPLQPAPAQETERGR